jgi:hypothetical protein
MASIKNCCGWLPPKGNRNLWFWAILIIIKLTLQKTMSGYFHVSNMHVHTCSPLPIPQPHTFEPPLMSRFKVFHHLTWNFSGPNWAALLVTLCHSMIFHNLVCFHACVRASLKKRAELFQVVICIEADHHQQVFVFHFFACSLCYW